LIEKLTISGADNIKKDYYMTMAERHAMQETCRDQYAKNMPLAVTPKDFFHFLNDPDRRVVTKAWPLAPGVPLTNVSISNT